MDNCCFHSGDGGVVGVTFQFSFLLGENVGVLLGHCLTAAEVERCCDLSVVEM